MSTVLSQVLEHSTRRGIVPEIDPRLLRPTDEPIIWADCSKLKADRIGADDFARPDDRGHAGVLASKARIACSSFSATAASDGSKNRDKRGSSIFYF